MWLHLFLLRRNCNYDQKQTFCIRFRVNLKLSENGEYLKSHMTYSFQKIITQRKETFPALDRDHIKLKK